MPDNFPRPGLSAKSLGRHCIERFANHQCDGSEMAKSPLRCALCQGKLGLLVSRPLAARQLLPDLALQSDGSGRYDADLL